MSGTWEDYWAATRPVELTEPVAAEAGRLAGRHALRAADAVHLASLLAVGTAATIAVWDWRLRAGAQAAGVQVAPASFVTGAVVPVDGGRAALGQDPEARDVTAGDSA